MLFMTVPTAGTRQELLEELVESCGLPRDHVVIVATRPGLQLPEGTIVREDLGPINIQRWWALGIAVAEQRGATAVAVLNDDIRIGPQVVHDLEREMRRTGAAIASPRRDGIRTGLHRRPLVPYEPRLWGSLWVLDIAQDLRPDPRYRWWYGDNDLDIRARTKHGGVVLADVPFEHVHASAATFDSPDLLALAEIDGQRFEAQYARTLRLTRAWRKLARRGRR